MTCPQGTVQSFSNYGWVNCFHVSLQNPFPQMDLQCLKLNASSIPLQIYTIPRTIRDFLFSGFRDCSNTWEAESRIHSGSNIWCFQMDICPLLTQTEIITIYFSFQSSDFFCSFELNINSITHLVMFDLCTMNKQYCNL